MWASAATPRECRCIEGAVPRRRREFQAGRAAARAALHALGIDHFDLLTGAFREPLWPDGVVGSITHAAERCVAAAALSTQIASLGIDLETAGELTADVIAIVCSAEEREQLLRMPNPYVAAKIVFSAKEAFFKAYFPQAHTFLDFQDVTIALHPERQEFKATLVNSGVPLLFGSQQATGRYRIADGFIYTAVAIIA